MRPLTLKLQAFGPFAGTQSLDFRELGERTLFLIHGPTGAGKTTILDALSFALFGESSGAERAGNQLRSDFADSKLPTEVSLDFQHGDNRYRVTRRPAQRLAKLRGEGLTDKTPEAEFWRIAHADSDDEKLESLAQKTGDCTKAVVQLLGLDASQFRQVILIPQGQFRQFLLASTDDREKIFQTLFQTGRYRAIQERLKLNARDTSELVARNREKRIILLEQSESEDCAALDKILADLDSALATLTKQQQAAAEKLADATRQRSHFDRLLETIDLQAAHQNDQKNATGALAEAAATAKTVAKNLTDSEQREPERAQWREQRTKLQELLPQLDKFQKSVAEAAAADKKLAALQTTLKTSAQRIEQQVALEKTLGGQIDKLRTTAAEAEGRKLKRDQAAQRVNCRKQLDQAVVAYQKAEAQTAKTLAGGKACKQAVETAKAAHKALLDQRHNARAASLAAELLPNTACPVCGATDHPAPAVSDAAIPDDDAIEAAERAITDADKAVDRARDQWREDNTRSTELKTRVDSLSQQLGDQLKTDLSELERQLADTDKAARAAADAAESLKLAEKQRRETSDLAEQLRREQKRAETEIETTRSARDTAVARRDQLGEQIAEPLREPGRLQRDLAALDEKIQAAEKQLAALRDQKSQADSAAAAAKSRLAEIAKAGQTISDQLATQRESFAEILKDTAADDTPLTHELLQPVRDRLVAAENEAAQQADQLNTSAGALRASVETRRKERRQIADLDSDYEKLEAEYRVTGRLAEVAGGDNSQKVTFQRFVLGALLDEVLQSASHRLHSMSRGRYQMYRSRDSRRGGGLDLEVLDHHSGVARPVATLSGGESFLASLSLALGIADVTESHAGGVRMETMFIDEGFGTLDSEALDLAFKTLYDLQEGGRLVGVISHVAELRERIDTRLEVTSHERGSSAKFVV